MAVSDPTPEAADPYAVLGLPHDADEASVRAARRRLLHRVHPDTAGDLPDAAEQTRRINDAYAAIRRRLERAAAIRERAEALPPVEVAPAYAWVESPYPMPPRRTGAATLGMIAALVGLPAVAMTLPGVPGHVAAMLPVEGTRAAAFARSGLHQVRRLLTPDGFAVPRAAPAPTPAAPPSVAAVDPATVASAVAQLARVERRGGPDAVAAYSHDCAKRATQFGHAPALDFCAAFDIAADRIDEETAARRYAAIGQPDRLDAVKALVR